MFLGHRFDIDIGVDITADPPPPPSNYLNIHIYGLSLLTTVSCHLKSLFKGA